MKHMKKSMFISTVMMVVLLIVALSTATFAWFSANDTVFATQTTLTAAQSSSANIKIGWLGGTFGSSISFDTASNIEPSIPLLEPSKIIYTSTAQYVSTNIDRIGIDFSYTDIYNTTYEDVPYINVVDINLGNTISKSNVTSVNFNGLQYENEVSATDLIDQPEYLLGRLYRTQHARGSYYLVTNQIINTEIVDVIAFDSYNGNNFLTITSSPVAENDITPDGAITEFTTLWDGDFNANLPDDNEYGVKYDQLGDLDAFTGYRIYHIQAIDDIHTVYPIWDVPTNFIPSSGIISSGVEYNEQNVDFFTIVTTAGVLDTKVEVGEDTEYYINIGDAKSGLLADPETSVDATAASGDKIYLVREDIERARTIFSVFSEQFYSTTIDQDARFKSNGNTAVTEKLNELGASEQTIFILKNDSGAGAAPAIMDLTVTIPPGALIRDDLRLAIFVKNAGETNFFYAGTVSTEVDALTYYGTIVHGAYSNPVDLQYYLADGLSLTSLVTIEAGTEAQIQVIAWYDGIGLDDAKSGQAANFTLVFSAQG